MTTREAAERILLSDVPALHDVRLWALEIIRYEAREQGRIAASSMSLQTLTAERLNELDSMIAQDGESILIKRVKAVREWTGCLLKEGKEFIDARYPR